MSRNSSSVTRTGAGVLFASPSSAEDIKPFLKFLSSKGVKKIQSVRDCTVSCVGKGITESSKLSLAVLLGKDIIKGQLSHRQRSFQHAERIFDELRVRM